ncbi:hypothetical protein WDJ51_06615 [Rathayibacter sp. YIM 133350]|uniref:hypothetical protein n=1 Tax=Rathayibacter sp. YIM 133350 TaxID=3131992 RepID=UPI00307D841C
MPARATALIALAGALLLTLCGCTNTDKASRPVPSVTAGPIAVTAHPGDGILRVATVLDGGDAAAVSAAVVAGTELAAREVDEQGGVAGADLVLIHRVIGGDGAALAADLLAHGVDVVLWGGAADADAGLRDALGAAGTSIVPLPALGDPGALAPVDDTFAARLKSADPGLEALSGGPEGYDVLLRLALAAISAHNDSGAAVAAALPDLSHDGFECSGWGQCADALSDGSDISYRGVAATP